MITTTTGGLSRVGISYDFLRFWNLESCLCRKTLYTFEYFRILYFNYHEILFGIWNLCQKTVGFGISYRNLVGVRPLAQQAVRYIYTDLVKIPNKQGSYTFRKEVPQSQVTPYQLLTCPKTFSGLLRKEPWVKRWIVGEHPRTYTAEFKYHHYSYCISKYTSRLFVQSGLFCLYSQGHARGHQTNHVTEADNLILFRKCT